MASPTIPPDKPTTNKHPTRFVVTIGSVIALGIMGDSLMYNLLPLEGSALGFLPIQVGILLSANRIMRLLSNTWASLAFERWGPRIPFIFAAVLAVLTTTLYGAGWGFIVFLLARAGWGISWSAFRQGGYVAVWAAPEAIKGRLMGILWGVVRFGSAISVLLGGLLYDRYGFTAAVMPIALLTILSVPMALLVRWPAQLPRLKISQTARMSGWREAIQTAPRRWGLAVGFMVPLFEGTLGASLSRYLDIRLGGEITSLAFGIGTLAGSLLALRFIANFFIGPLLGALSDKLGQAPTIVLLSAVILSGITATILAPGLWPLAFLALVFFAGSGIFAVISAASSELANQTSRPHLFVGIFTTSIDLGAAVGPLLAFSLGDFFGFSPIYIMVAVLQLFTAIRFWQVERQTDK
ncbi:MAG: MFS transporter [Chloroflexi bacterium]|nr:MFS transporter [Chloroflexota bacterium]